MGRACFCNIVFLFTSFQIFWYPKPWQLLADKPADETEICLNVNQLNVSKYPLCMRRIPRLSILLRCFCAHILSELISCPGLEKLVSTHWRLIDRMHFRVVERLWSPMFVVKATVSDETLRLFSVTWHDPTEREVFSVDKFVTIISMLTS